LNLLRRRRSPTVNPLLLHWAKLGSATWPEKYHPVLCHLIDVGQVAWRLWSDVCRSKVRDWVTNRLGLPDHDAAGTWLAFCAGAHDIGKVSPCCQHRGERANFFPCHAGNRGGQRVSSSTLHQAEVVSGSAQGDRPCPGTCCPGRSSAANGQRCPDAHHAGDSPSRKSAGALNRRSSG
jgi:hypothetical protein